MLFRFVLCVLALSSLLQSGCHGDSTDGGQAVVTAYEAATAGDFARFAETLKDGALEEYGNRAAMERLGDRLRGLGKPHVIGVEHRSTRTWGDPTRPPWQLVEYLWDVEAAADGEGFRALWDLTVECIYLEKRIGYAVGEASKLVHCKITRID